MDEREPFMGAEMCSRRELGKRDEELRAHYSRAVIIIDHFPLLALHTLSLGRKAEISVVLDFAPGLATRRERGR
jgi:hypothetical protein